MGLVIVYFLFMLILFLFIGNNENKENMNNKKYKKTIDSTKSFSFEIMRIGLIISCLSFLYLLLK